MLSLILFVAAIGYTALDILEGKAADIVTDSMRMQRMESEVDSRLQLARQAERDFVLRIHDLGVEGSRAVYANEFAERIGEAGRNVTWLQDMKDFNKSGSAVFSSMSSLNELQSHLESYSETFRAVVEMASEEDVSDSVFDRMVSDLDGKYLRLTSLVRQLAISATDGARNAHEGIVDWSELVKNALVLSVVFALLLAVSIVWVLNQTVATSVVRLSDTAMELSLGNLDARADVKSDDEFGQLADSINRMATRITRLVDELEGQAAMASDRLFEAIDSISEGFLLYDQHDRLVLTNCRIMEMAGDNSDYLQPGRAAKDVIRRNAESGLFVNAYGREEEWIQERLDQHRRPAHPMEEPLSDGRWVLFTTYLTSRGESVVIVSDITERKQRDLDLVTMNSDLEELVRDRTTVLVEKASELKRANERLQELDELKTAFLSSVSHELRTPLTSLLGFTKIIKRDFSKAFMPLAMEDKSMKLGVRIQTNLDIISNEGERLTRLINDVLDLSRIESGQDDWHFSEVDMAGAINQAVSAASGVFESKPHVQLEIRRFEPVPLVHCDPDRLHQVIINLLSNAAKFTEAGSVAVDLYVDESGMVRIRVEDTGCGIDTRYLDQVFDKFHQAHKGNTLTGKPEGTGLGLAISRQIVERYDGQIWADSRLGRGTVMNIALPPAAPDDKTYVLVVDDDESARDYMSLVLKKAGYGVRTASDGQSAITMVEERIPALITMDINMPGMDGRTAIEVIRKNEAMAGIPILVVSDIDSSRASGGDAALVKPIHGDAFIGTVGSLTGGKISSRPVIALTDPSICTLSALCGEEVTQCSVGEMWKLLGSGFKGTVVIPESMTEDLNMNRICATPNVQVILLPV